MCCDASDVGIAAVLCHKDDGFIKPVVFVSRTLTDTEKRYPILHREFLAVVFGLEKLYKYVYGQKTTVYTDHKPLQGVVKNGNTVFAAANRVHRYLLRINLFDIDLVYRPGKFNAIADFPSRFPSKDGVVSDEDSEEERLTCRINCVTDGKSLNLNVLIQETETDALLAKLIEAIQSSKDFSGDLKQFSGVKEQLNIVSGLITVNGRILIPLTLRKAALAMLHELHIGVVRMKQLARNYMYWPGMNEDILKLSKACEICRSFNADTQSKIFVPWPEPKQPFDRVHIDFFHLESKTFFLLVDSYSKWVEVALMNRTTAEDVVKVLKNIFLRFGDPKVIVSDNGPPFNSEELDKFCQESMIKLIHSPPYHPQSNRLAERWVQTIKAVFKKNLTGNYTDSKVQEVLKLLRNTPTNGSVPSHMVFGYKPRTNFEKLLPDNNLDQTKVNIPKQRIFSIGDLVTVSGQSGVRTKGRVVKQSGQVTYEVEINGARRVVHANQLVKLTDLGAQVTQVPVATTHSRPTVPTVTQKRILAQRNRKPPSRLNL